MALAETVCYRGLKGVGYESSRPRSSGAVRCGDGRLRV